MVERLRPIESLDACYVAEPVSVSRARAEVGRLAALAGAGEEALDDVRLAVSEAVSNAVVHAYGQDAAGIVHVTAAAIDGELTVLVADDGCGLGEAPQSEGLGLGLGLIAQMCDSLTVTGRSSGGTQVEMSFKLSSHPDASGSPHGSCEGDQEGRGSLSSALRPA